MAEEYRCTGSLQVMPDLTPEQDEALRSEIRRNGVLVPVTVDQHGRILDGHNRKRIADELGIDCPTVVREVTDDDEAHDLAVALNCARRHLTQEQKRSIIRDEIVRRPGDSDRKIARRVGCSPTTVGTVRAEIQAETDEQKRDAIHDELLNHYNDSDRSIAGRVGCSVAAVTAARPEVEAETDRAIRQWLDDLRDQLAMLAMTLHYGDRDRRPMNWQSVGDVMERAHIPRLREELDDVEAELAEMAGLFGPFFDSVRAYDCLPDCEVCTPQFRRWREAFPRQVYRHTEPPLSNLDTQDDHESP